MEEKEELARDIAEILNENGIEEDGEYFFSVIDLFYRKADDYGLSLEEAQEIAKKTLAIRYSMEK